MKKKAICLMLALMLVCMDARAAAVLEVGSRGDDVVKVQKRLIQYDYLDGTADGRYGEGGERHIHQLCVLRPPAAGQVRVCRGPGRTL